MLGVVIAAVSLIVPGALRAAGDDEFAPMYKDIKFDMPRVERPVIPDTRVSLTDFGAVGDGLIKNTGAFAKAIAHLAAKGGGHLDVPSGIWLTGPIVLDDNIDLHLEAGALVLFSGDLADYPVEVSSFEGWTTHRAQAPISARGKKNISITGLGTIDGNGGKWRPVKRAKTTEAQWKALSATGVIGKKGDIWYPNDRIREVSESKELTKGSLQNADTIDWNYVHDFLRPCLVALVDCKNVLLEDATFQNSPSWNIHPLLCDNVILNRVTVRNPWYAQNGDGLDAESCNGVLVYRCSFDVGDDAICIKSGKDREGRERGVPCRNVLIEDCTVYNGHGGFVIGSEMSGGARDISIRNCNFIGTDCGLRFKSTRGRGGVVSNIWVDAVNMINIDGDGLIFDLYYGNKGPVTTMPVTDETPSFRDIYINKVNCINARRCIFFNGLPEMPVKDVAISNSVFTGDTGVTLNYVDGLKLDNVSVRCREGNLVNSTHLTGLECDAATRKSLGL